MESFTAADFFDETSANVTNMAEMFNLCNFNQNISGWDVSSVTDMRAMFKDSEFNQNISS